MNNFILIFQLVVQLLPLVTQAVTAVEAALPAGGQGAKKLDLVKNMLQSSYQSAGGVTVAFEQLWPAISSAVSGIVALYNVTGKFAPAPK